MSEVFVTELSADISKTQKTKTDKDIAAFLFLQTSCCFEDFGEIMENVTKCEEISFEENQKNQDSIEFDGEENLDYEVYGENLNSVLFLTPVSNRELEKSHQKIADNMYIDNEEICEIISNDKSFVFEEKNESKKTEETKNFAAQNFVDEKNVESKKKDDLELRKSTEFVEKTNLKNKSEIAEKTNKVAFYEKDQIKNNISRDNNQKPDKTAKDTDLKTKFENLNIKIEEKKDFLEGKNFGFSEPEQKSNSYRLLKQKDLKNIFEIFTENKEYSYKNFKNINQEIENKTYSGGKNYENNLKEKTGTERIKLDIADEKIGKINLDMKIKNGEMSIKFDAEDKEKNKNVFLNKNEIEEQIVKNTGVKKAEISLSVNTEDRKERNEKNKKKFLYSKKNDKNKESFKVGV